MAKLANSVSKIFRFPKEEQVDPEFFSKTSFVQLGYGIWVNLSSLTVGLAFGFSGVALPQMMAPDSKIKLTLADEAWITSVVTLSAPIGCIISGYCLDIYGRKMMLTLGQLPTAVGWIVTGFSKSPIHLIIGRLITGVGVGMLMTPPRIYVTEISLPNMRGPLGVFNNLAMSIGLGLQAIMGSAVKWHLNSFFCAAFTITTLISNLFLPETPYFTLMNNDEDTVMRTLKKFRAENYKNLDSEMDDLMDFKMNNVRKLKLKEWLELMVSPSSLKPFCMMVPYMIAAQISGANTIFFYIIEVLRDSKISLSPHLGSVILTITRFCGSILAAIMLFKFGRRPLALISCIGCGVVFIYLGCYLDFIAVKPSIQPQIMYILFVIFASLGYYSLILLILFELLPLQVRGIMSGLAQSLMNLSMFATNEIFPFARQAIKFSNTLIVMGASSLLFTLYLYFFLPETKRMTLQEIEEFYKKIRPTLTSQRDLRANISRSKYESSSVNLGLNRTKSLDRHKKEKYLSKSRLNSVEASKRRTSDVDTPDTTTIEGQTEKDTKVKIVEENEPKKDKEQDKIGNEPKKNKEKGIKIKDDD